MSPSPHTGSRADPGTLPDVLTVPATELARRIRAGELSAAEAVEAHIARIRAVDPMLNALVAERFEAARAEAELADEAVRRGEAGPLAGVPFTVKEMVNLEGMPVTFGSRRRLGRVAEGDAVVVSRLRAAGAIPLGVTNVPEWGFWFETANLVYGRTRNPYDLRRTPGGSSGGEAALVAAGASPFGIGADIGGSIRMPAAFCGIFGHKPTTGLVPLTGHWPVYAGGPEARLDKRNPYVVLGPLARSARDLAPLLRILAGPDGVDPNARAMELGDPAAVQWSRTRAYAIEDPRILLAASPDPPIRAAVAAAVAALEAAGVHVETLDPEPFRRAAHLWFAALRDMGGFSLREILGAGRPITLPVEIAKTLFGRGEYSLPALLFCLGEAAGHVLISDRRVRELVEEGTRLQAALEKELGPEGILVLPAHPRVAPPHNTPLLRPFDFAYTAVLNVLGFPATVAPVGLDPRGLPRAVQITAARGADHLTIAGAMLLEDAFGGWTPARGAG